MEVLVIKLTLEEGRYSSPRAEFIDLSAGELRDACVGLGTAHNLSSFLRSSNYITTRSQKDFIQRVNIRKEAGIYCNHPLSKT
jgi:hypothetical protein